MIPKPSTSGTTLAHVTIARSRFVSEGTEFATAQPMKKCVMGLIQSPSINTGASDSIHRIFNDGANGNSALPAVNNFSL